MTSNVATPFTEEFDPPVHKVFNIPWIYRLITAQQLRNYEFKMILNDVPTYNYKHTFITSSPRRYPYFDVVVGLVWSHDPKSYAGGSLSYW
jgi:hypothetical protein